MRIFVSPALVLLFATFAFGQVDELDRAKSLFQETEDRQAEIVRDAFDRRIKEAIRDGNLQLTNSLQSEQAKFKSKRQLPASKEMKSFGEKYFKAMESARDKLAEAFEQEVKSETRAGHLDAARRYQSELDRLKSRPLAVAAVEEIPQKPVVNVVVVPAPKPVAGPVGPQPVPVAPVGGGAVGANPNILVRSAIWKQDGRFGVAGPQVQNVQAAMQNALLAGVAFEPNQGTLSLLDGRSVTKSVYLDMVFYGTVFSGAVAENSSIRIRAATALELAMQGSRIGNTNVDVVSFIYQTRDGTIKLDRSSLMRQLAQGNLVSISGPSFPDLKFGTPKLAVILLRVGPRILDFKAAEGSSFSIKAPGQ